MSLDLLRKHASVAIIGSTLALCALFLAQGATSLIAGAVLPIEPVESTEAQGSAKKLPGTEHPSFTDILKRNIFDPTTGALWPPPPPDPVEEITEEEGQALRPGQLPPACEGSGKLVASVYSDRRPEWSFASLSEGSGPPLLYRQGSKFDDKEVESIFPKAVFLRGNNGRLCSIGMFNELPESSERPKPPPKPTRKARRSTSRGGIDNEALEDGIKKSGDNKFAVERSLVDKVLQNQAEIMRSARIVPHEQNGEVVGVKLYGIRRNSLLGKLGLQNGDLLQKINGYDMASPDSALEAYSRLRNASNISVSVTRRGKPMTVEYQIE